MIRSYLKILFLTSLFLENHSTYSQEEQQHLQVKGQILNSSGKVKKVLIRIIELEHKADTILINKGKYNIELNLNSEFLLEFIAEDHFIKRIAFNTEISKKKKIPYFDLKINLHEKYIWEISEDDKDLLDLPVAYIKYDSKKDLFYDYNKKYSKIIKKEISKLIKK